MAITITARDGDPVMMGLDKRAVFTIALDSSYPAGGESLTPSANGFAYFDMVAAEPAMGYTFEYDHTNNKLKAFAKAPPVVIEEKHTSASKLLTLDYPAAWIMSVSSGSTGKVWCKTGTASGTLGAAEFCLTTAIVDGTRSVIRLGTSGTVYVTYATQAWDELYNLLVQDEAVTGASAGATPDNTLMGYGYACTSSGTGVLIPICDDDTAAAGEVAVDFNTKTAALTFNAAQSGTVYYVTYLKAPSAGFIYDRIVTDEAMTTGVASYSDKPIGCWLLSGAGTVTGGTTDYMTTRDATTTAGLFKILWGETPGTAVTGTRGSSTPMYGGGATSGKLIDMAYITCNFWEIPTVPLEVRNGTDLSNVTDLRVVVYGR